VTNSRAQNCGSAAPGRASCQSVHGGFPSHRRGLVHAGPTAPTITIGWRASTAALRAGVPDFLLQRAAAGIGECPRSHGPRPDTPSVRVAVPLTLIMRCHAPGEPVRTARAVLCPCHTSRQAVGAYMHACPRLAWPGRPPQTPPLVAAAWFRHRSALAANQASDGARAFVAVGGSCNGRLAFGRRDVEGPRAWPWAPAGDRKGKGSDGQWILPLLAQRGHNFPGPDVQSRQGCRQIIPGLRIMRPRIDETIGATAQSCLLSFAR